MYFSVSRLITLSSQNLQNEVKKDNKTYSSGEITYLRKLRAKYPPIQKVIPPPPIITQPISIQTNPEIVAQISADGQPPTPDISNNCWYYTNINPQKINWYFYADNAGINALQSFEFFYIKVDIRNTDVSNKPWITLYTLPKNDGNDALWYRTRYNYTGYYLSGENVPTGKYVYYIGDITKSVVDYTGYTPVKLDNYPIEITGIEEPNDKVWLIAINTNSVESTGIFDFCLSQVGYKFTGNPEQQIQTIA